MGWRGGVAALGSARITPAPFVVDSNILNANGIEELKKLVFTVGGDDDKKKTAAFGDVLTSYRKLAEAQDPRSFLLQCTSPFTRALQFVGLARLANKIEGLPVFSPVCLLDKIEIDLRGVIRHIPKKNHCTIDLGEIKLNPSDASAAKVQLLLRIAAFEYAVEAIHPDIETWLRIGRVFTRHHEQKGKSSDEDWGISFYIHPV
jgi:hypothetical protein